MIMDNNTEVSSMDKMRMESPDLTQRNVEAIGALFPNCITETRGADGAIRRAINFDMLRQMLTDDAIALSGICRI